MRQRTHWPPKPDSADVCASIPTGTIPSTQPQYNSGETGVMLHEMSPSEIPRGTMRQALVPGTQSSTRTDNVMVGAGRCLQTCGLLQPILAPRGTLSRVVTFTFANTKVTHVEVIGDSARLRELDIAVLELRRFRAR